MESDLKSSENSLQRANKNYQQALEDYQEAVRDYSGNTYKGRQHHRYDHPRQFHCLRGKACVWIQDGKINFNGDVKDYAAII